MTNAQFQHLLNKTYHLHKGQEDAAMNLLQATYSRDATTNIIFHFCEVVANHLMTALSRPAIGKPAFEQVSGRYRSQLTQTNS